MKGHPDVFRKLRNNIENNILHLISFYTDKYLVSKKSLLIIAASLFFIISCLNLGCNARIDNFRNNYPLEGKILVDFFEIDSNLSLSLSTQKIYGSCDDTIVAQLSIKRSQILVEIEGIYFPATVQPLNGPASTSLKLGKLSGQYNLTFRYSDIEDNYLLNINSNEITLEPSEGKITVSEHNLWHRGPSE